MHCSSSERVTAIKTTVVNCDGNFIFIPTAPHRTNRNAIHSPLTCLLMKFTHQTQNRSHALYSSSESHAHQNAKKRAAKFGKLSIFLCGCYPCCMLSFKLCAAVKVFHFVKCHFLAAACAVLGSVPVPRFFVL